METGQEQEPRDKKKGKEKSNSQEKPRGRVKLQEVDVQTTPSRARSGEIRRPKEEGSPYTPNQLQSKLPGAAREEARKYQSWGAQDTP